MMKWTSGGIRNDEMDCDTLNVGDVRDTEG